MDFMNQIDCILMISSSSEDEEVVHRVRRPYRTLSRSTVKSFDVVDLQKYFRLTKNAFWRLHSTVRDVLEGDLRRYVRDFYFISCCVFILILILLVCVSWPQSTDCLVCCACSPAATSNKQPQTTLAFHSQQWQILCLPCATRFSATSIPSFWCRERNVSAGKGGSICREK